MLQAPLRLKTARSAEHGVPTQDWLSRGLKTPSGRDGTASLCPMPPSTSSLSATAYRCTAAGDKQWPAGWLPGDEPVAIVCDEDADPFAHVRVFDREARVRFLDVLADSGNVSRAAARVGVSRETAYRARRRHADFARVWDAALVHARARGEAELASRALDGVAVPVKVAASMSRPSQARCTLPARASRAARPADRRGCGRSASCRAVRRIARRNGSINRRRFRRGGP